MSPRTGHTVESSRVGTVARSANPPMKWRNITNLKASPLRSCGPWRRRRSALLVPRTISEPSGRSAMCALPVEQTVCDSATPDETH